MLNQEVIDTIQPIKGVRLGVDKVVLGISLVKGGTKDFATKFHLEGEIYHSIHKRQIKKHAKAGHSAVVGRYFNATGDRRILTIVVGTIWGKPYCQFVFNPNCLAASDWDTIQEILSTCFEYGLAELLERSAIRKLELSMDFENVAPSTLVVLAAGIRSGAANCKGTRYCGKRTSPLSVATYDKAKQLAASTGATLGYDLTRVESRLVLPNSTLLDLAEGKGRNPWAKIFRRVAQGAEEGMREVFLRWSGDGEADRGIRAAPCYVRTLRKKQERASSAVGCLCVPRIRSSGRVGLAAEHARAVLSISRRAKLYGVSDSASVTYCSVR